MLFRKVGDIGAESERVMDLTSKESEVTSSGMEAKKEVEEIDINNDEPRDYSRSSPEASPEHPFGSSSHSDLANTSNTTSPLDCTFTSPIKLSPTPSTSSSVAPNGSSDNVYESAAKV